MDFTREPIIQTVITPKEGCKIVVRSSKNSGQEEYFVDAVEVVSFGTAIFFRSLERPKSFLVPASDYEVLEVREARMVLKNVGVDRAIKIGGGREAPARGGREHTHEKPESSQLESPETEGSEEGSKSETRLDKKRDRRRNARRRRGRGEETTVKEGEEEIEQGDESPKVELPKPNVPVGESGEAIPLTSVLTSLLPPPPTLISETIARYRDNASFKSAFFTKEEQGGNLEGAEEPTISIEQPEYGSFEMTDEEEEEIYRQRQRQREEEAQRATVEQPAEESASETEPQKEEESQPPQQ